MFTSTRQAMMALEVLLEEGRGKYFYNIITLTSEIILYKIIIKRNMICLIFQACVTREGSGDMKERNPAVRR